MGNFECPIHFNRSLNPVFGRCTLKHGVACLPHLVMAVCLVLLAQTDSYKDQATEVMVYFGMRVE